MMSAQSVALYIACGIPVGGLVYALMQMIPPSKQDKAHKEYTVCLVIIAIVAWKVALGMLAAVGLATLAYKASAKVGAVMLHAWGKVAKKGGKG